ncbi:MAG: hypothetical protein ABSE58_10245 [Candidatus Limnocylindrales bacterium]|jgi:hypothetical protein
MLLLIAAWGLLVVVAGVALWPRPRRAVVTVPGQNGPNASSNGGMVLALVRWVPCRYRPIALALLLALVSLPLIALTLGPTSAGDYVHQDQPIPVTALGQWSAAAGAAFFSALVAGRLGAGAVRRHAILGAFFTFVIALLVAVPALPLLPAMLGESVGVGRVCLDTCWALTGTNNLGDGLWSDVFFVLAPFYEPVPVLTLAVGVGVWTYLVRRLPDA